MSASTHSVPGSVVLLFGSQALTFLDDSLDRLRSAILSSPDHRWMKDVIQELPQTLSTYAISAPALRNPKTQQPFTGLVDWLNTGSLAVNTEALPNVILAPLTVLVQLTQYTQYLELTSAFTADGDSVGNHTQIHTLGFCTGLLASFVVSCSQSKSDLAKYGAVAVRLAALVGAIVDANNSTSNTLSFSTSWHTRDQRQDLNNIIDRYPEAYISVHYDDTRATITTSSGISASSFLQELRAAGILVAEYPLHGRFHSEAHHDTLRDLLTYCDSSPSLRLPDAADASAVIHPIAGEHVVSRGSLHHIALQAILVDQSQWHKAFHNTYLSTLRHKNSMLVTFGTEKCIPPTFVKHISSRVVHMNNADKAEKTLASLRIGHSESDSDIAIVGMSIKVAGADDLQEFWDLMLEAKSQHREVPEDRFTFDTHWRAKNEKRKWYGNFLRDHDAFDHKFFGKSPREMTTVDPQQRLMLQSAYQAVEQSGYLNQLEPDPKVGVFIGVCAADYEANVACYEPNAFSATGNLKSFIAGKISHYFGWTGPGLTIDTACSASAVAIHQACRAILSGECNAALAGGTNIMTNPLWFQNLAGASFLSPTGACKPFDAAADGYCRGEAVSAVFLKTVSQAVHDGDPIFGIIRSTAVYQNQNCTPIFVPNAPSLANLFEDVVRNSRLRPSDISLVEAHGTGTPIGDPAEYDSIRKVFGGTAQRSTSMPIGSIKGLIGHTECVSGVVALVKVIQLINQGVIPPQASFSQLSPNLNATPSDMLEVLTEQRPWIAQYRAALINNYGASGSNASMVVTSRLTVPDEQLSANGVKQPFWITGFDERSIIAYCDRLSILLKSDMIPTQHKNLANLSFNQTRQSNRHLDKAYQFTCGSIDELQQKLQAVSDDNTLITSRQSARPVILCFGGQTTRTIGLDKGLYDSIKSFRIHLDKCDEILRSLQLLPLFPTIFESHPIQDTVHLQTMLFALQYSCARTWLDAGIEVAAVVGHSFGELTALAVSGVLTLKQTLRTIAQRARLTQQSWGSDTGAMVAIEGSLADVESLISTVGAGEAEIACYNGPRSFTLAGSTSAITALIDSAATRPRLRYRRLAVSNAFHSKLVDPLMPDLQHLGQDVVFSKPHLRWERATERSTSPELQAGFFAEHMRRPVFADHAFRRLHEDFPEAVWLEAGSNSTITNMAGKALGMPSTSHFQAVDILNGDGVSRLADISVNLWEQGINHTFWQHHPVQSQDFVPLMLPPYQFQPSRHWLELKKPTKHISQVEPATRNLPTSLFTFVGYQDSNKSTGRFRINTMIQKYKDLVSGHVVADTAPICPATVEVDIAIEALLSLRPDLDSSEYQPGIHNVSNQVPICVNPTKAVWLELSSISDQLIWEWRFTSTEPHSSSSTLHVTGQISLSSVTDKRSISEFARYERIVGYQRAEELLNCSDPDDVLQGRNIYKVFADIVDYGKPFQHLRKLVGKDQTSAGRVVKKRSSDTWLDAQLADCFSQVGGFWINCMTDVPSTDMYIANGFESWLRSPKMAGMLDSADSPSIWDVYATHQCTSETSYMTDIFIFDANRHQLAEVILGISYAKIAKTSMSKMLKRLTVMDAVDAIPPSNAVKTGMPKAVSHQAIAAIDKATYMQGSSAEQHESVSRKTKTAIYRSADVLHSVIEILIELTGLGSDRIKANSRLADIGIDSLMGMEMAHELEAKFKCGLDLEELSEVTTVQEVVDTIEALVPLDSGAEDRGGENVEDEDAGYSTPYSNLSSDENSHKSATSSISSIGERLAEHQVPKMDLKLSTTAVLDSFGEIKAMTDDYFRQFGCDGYLDKAYPRQIRLCIALVLEAFEQLGCDIRTAKAGDRLQRIEYAAEHRQLAKHLYDVLENEARLIDIEGDMIIRTAVSAPTKSSKVLLESMADLQDHAWANKLTYYCGTRLAEVLQGQVDGLKLIFGTPEGRVLIAGLYGDSLLNKLFTELLEQFLIRLISKLPNDHGPLKILEMGAGTGGTTKHIVPMLAKLGFPVEYTFTDLSPSFTAAARKTFKQYSFMRFETHNIEHEPPDDLIGTQHIVIAANAVHATRNLTLSASNIRKALRPDGVLIMLEMTSTLCWVDVIFGLFEGWWRFDDGRRHAIASESTWERELQSAGFGHVDWTDGHLEENRIQKLIFAFASGPKFDRLPVAIKHSAPKPLDHSARKAAVDRYVAQYTEDFVCEQSITQLPKIPELTCVMVTGATGSLGAHLVEHLAKLPKVGKVICMNRHTRGAVAASRQLHAMQTKGLSLDESALSKIEIIETNTAAPKLGLPDERYRELTDQVTTIIHNAWPMSGKRGIDGFEIQFRVMRNLIDFANDAASSQHNAITFQFISSIAVTGYYPVATGFANVPEVQMEIAHVLPNGYGEAKYVCELMLDETLHKHPQHFRAMSVRLGQVAGSTQTGYWNCVEHFPFLIKSSQTLRCLPKLPGALSWSPVDKVAVILTDLLQVEHLRSLYHIDNSSRQAWADMLPILADELNIPHHKSVPLHEWVQRVRRFPGSAEKDNPAFKLADFLGDDFIRMSCGGVLLNTENTKKHSETLASLGPVNEEVVRAYVGSWRQSGFLH